MKAFCLKSMVAIGLASLFTGCSTCCWNNNKNLPVAVQSVYTPVPLQLDGNLAEPAWQSAPVYSLQLGKEVYNKLPVVMKATVGKELREAGECRLLWDDNYLYVGAQFTDSDVYAYGEEDQQHHYLLGDVLEVFIKPENETYYWELYGTPSEKITTFFIPGRGALFSELLTKEPIVIKVASQVQGSLNQWKDRDQSWSIEIAIPRAELEKYGAEFAPSKAWRIFLSRYNYSRYLPSKELSSFPQQRETPNFHLYEEYGKLELLKP